MTTPTQPLWESQKVPVWSLGDGLLRIYQQVSRDRHGIRPHINHLGLAYAQGNLRRTSVSRLQKPLPTVHPQIRQGNGTNLRPTKAIDKQMGMDMKGKVRILETPESNYQSTDPPAFRLGKAYYPSDGLKWLRNRRYSQPVGRFWDSQTGLLLFSKMPPCRTELWPLWTGGISHSGDCEAITTLSRGSQS